MVTNDDDLTVLANLWEIMFQSMRYIIVHSVCKLHIVHKSPCICLHESSCTCFERQVQLELDLHLNTMCTIICTLWASWSNSALDLRNIRTNILIKQLFMRRIHCSTLFLDKKTKETKFEPAYHMVNQG